MAERPRRITDQWSDFTVSSELEPGGVWIAKMVYVTLPRETDIGPMNDSDGFPRGRITAPTVRQAVEIENALGRKRFIPIGEVPAWIDPEELPHRTIPYEQGVIRKRGRSALEKALDSPAARVLSLVDTDQELRERGGDLHSRPKREQGGWGLKVSE